MISAIALVSVVALIAVAAFYFGSSGRTRINSVAVLPFSNASGDPSMEYLSDGITEGVIDRLSGLPNVKVISRTSAFRYKQRDIEPQKVAKELGVDALVTGRVVQRGDDLSVSAELVYAREDRQLWGEQYSRKLADAVTVQQEIATAISGNLRVRLTQEEKTRLAKSPATNPEAYQLYLKGRYHANQTTAAEVKKGIAYFQQAIDKDPGYALAYAGLADSYTVLGGGYMYVPPSDSFPKAKAAAMKALELDDTLAEAHAALAYAVLFADWDWPSTEREFKRAIELNPNSALSHSRYAECLKTRLRFNESMAEAQRAQELDPLSPDIVSELGVVAFHGAPIRCVYCSVPEGARPQSKPPGSACHAGSGIRDEAHVSAGPRRIRQNCRSGQSHSSGEPVRCCRPWLAIRRLGQADRCAEDCRGVQGFVRARLCRFLLAWHDLCGPRRQGRGVTFA